MFKGVKRKFAAMLASITAISTSLFVSASTPTLDVSDAIGAGMTSVAGEIMGVIAVALPIVLGVVGAIIAIRFGINFLRSMFRG